MQSSVVLITFPEPSKCYEYLTRLQQMDAAGELTLDSAAIVKRDSDGKLQVDTGADNEAGSGALGGGLIGALVGILGGPVGVLLGWATGALVGTSVDLDDDADGLAVLDDVAKRIEPGQTALIAHVEEPSAAVVDETVAADGGTVQRWDAEALVADLEAAAEVRAEDEREARKQAREEKRAQDKAKIKDKLEEFKKKLTGN
ncbi:DUF1269 domain-containing protein [Naumannella cuiyingiana]|uniref:Putative membrane protein n=1 Tax=Naumannella cuiyingiana TaxID=1347891 RepID=A0A7Z0IKQ7_9ACTN|nr:DUF1269 domain-containing protein [Naumannella cuiyingiana]NYI70702.1 putative membrane protein [Naumannella cuiyingiana]